MRTQLKSTLALVLALLICVSVFAACNNEPGSETSSGGDLISIAPVPSTAEIDIESGEISIAAGSTFADLKEDLMEQGKIAEGETLQLFQADTVTEIIDEATPLEDGMIVIKKDAEGNEVFHLTVVLVYEVLSTYVDSEGNTVIVTSKGTEVVDSTGQVISETVNPPITG